MLRYLYNIRLESDSNNPTFKAKKDTRGSAGKVIKKYHQSKAREKNGLVGHTTLPSICKLFLHSRRMPSMINSIVFHMLFDCHSALLKDINQAIFLCDSAVKPGTGLLVVWRRGRGAVCYGGEG